MVLNPRASKTPPVYLKTRGDKRMALAIADDVDLRMQAMAAYEKDMKSAGDTSHFNVVTWEDLHRAWWATLPGGSQVAVLPLTPAKIAAVGCLLKSAGYRSAHNYIAAAKDRHLADGYEWSEVLGHAYRRFTLSVQRGVGPPKQSEPLKFHVLVAMPLPTAPLVHGGPVNTKGLVVLYTYWFVRDVEGALARFSDVTINTSEKMVSWRLSVSKADPAALGCVRKWGCLCPAICPYHAALAHKAVCEGPVRGSH